MARISLEIKGGPQLLSKWESGLRNLSSQLRVTMLQEMDKTRKWAIQNRMEHTPGPPSDLLHQRTGHLANSIHGDAQASEGVITGTLAAGVPYAAQHELGLTVSIPETIQHRTQAFGRETNPFTVTVAAHTATYPQRAFLKPSLEARRQNILEALGYTIRRAFQ